MYDIEFSKSAEKQFYKLEKEIQSRIVSILERIRIRPEIHIKKLVGNPYFSVRIGKYRLILDLWKGKLVIYVIDIGLRKKIYKK